MILGRSTTKLIYGNEMTWSCAPLPTAFQVGQYDVQYGITSLSSVSVVSRVLRSSLMVLFSHLTQKNLAKLSRHSCMYGVGILTTRTTLKNKKPEELRRSLLLSFYWRARRRFRHTFAALRSQPERLGEVRRRAIFVTPSWSFSEASWVRVRPCSSLFASGRLTKNENVV